MANIFKQFFTKQLSNSLGFVARNYAKAPEFNPTYQVTGITYKAIDKIGQTLSVYEPIIQKRNGESYVNHPLLTLFNNPNPRSTGADFIHLYGMLFEIYGETFWYLARGETTKRVKEIYLLNPAQIELKLDNGELVGYIYHKSNATQIPLLLDEVIHDKRPNPFNEWRGMSVLEKAATYIETEIISSRFTFNYIKNSGSPSGIVSLPNMTKEAFIQFAQQWREGYEGPENAGKTAFIRGEEAKFQAVGATLKDIDQKITREMAKDDVLMMLDVPKPLLGLTDDKGFGRGNVETLKYIFAESKLEPMMTRLDGIYSKISESFGREGAVKVTHDSPIPEDKEFIQKQNKELVNIALTVNEVRDTMGLPPLVGGDELIPDNAAAQPMPVEQVKTIKVVKKSKTVEAPIKKDFENKEQFRKDLISNNDIYAKKIKSEMTKFAQTQESTVIDKINVSSKAYEEWLFNIKDESEALAKLLTPIVIELMETQSVNVANFITGELLTITPEIRTAVEHNILKISGVYNQDTITGLQATLTEGQTVGESLAKLKQRVEGVYDQAKGYRAERIARTESLKASNRTAEEVYKQNGYSKVEWFVNPGACEFCRTYAGKTREIGSNFTPLGAVVDGAEGGQLRIEYSDIDVPPLHPNCVIGDTKIVSPDATNVIKSHYSGEVINIKTANGRSLTVTPNHVILTDKGWVAAKFLNKSHQIISQTLSDRIVIANPSTYQSPTTIADVFDSLRKSNSMTTNSVPVSTKYLKGDAAFSKGNIDIISADGLLRDNIKITKKLEGFFFVDRHSRVSKFSGLSDFTSMLITLGAASDGSVGISDITRLLGRSTLTSDNLVGLFSTPNYNARLLKAANNSRSANTETLSKAIRTLADIIEVDNVISIEREVFHGDIYDVSSISTLYSANGIISSNCTCTINAVD